jgi:hypothetical protein
LSSDDSDGGLPPPLPSKSMNMGFKLAIGGLGLSTVMKEGQIKTNEELGDMKALEESKNAGKNKKKESSSDEDVSSDEEYYREMERIKSQGG